MIVDGCSAAQAVIRVAWKSPGSHDQVAFEGGGYAHLDPELVGLSAFALANALDLWGVKCIELAFALTILLGCRLRSDALCALQGGLQGLFGRFGADCVGELALDFTPQAAQDSALAANRFAHAPELSGVAIASRFA